MQFGDVRPDSVVFTLTDYAQDPREDAWLVEFLLKEYRRVYFFPQGAGDLKYLRSLVSGDCINRILTIDRSLSAYDALLERENLDYVGTRLHGGIRALQKGRRATIISLDNRAESISMDTGLPTVQRYQAQKVLAKVVCERADIHLRLNRTGVEQFLESLRINVCEDGFSAS
jgi:polysaccharide pyruvyl transferase WcaK-like protein